MSIITLTTDFGTKDYAIAAIKGKLYSDLATCTIVDISHHITPYNITEAAYILGAAYPNFPKGSIHLIGVDSEKNALQKHLIVQVNGHFFITADNGILSLLSKEDSIETIIEIQHPKSDTSSFPTLDVFVDVAIEIYNGTPLNNIGVPIDSIKKWIINKPNISRENELIGYIIYIDEIGNMITDISKNIFENAINNRNFEIIVGSVKVKKIHSNYSSLIDFSLPERQRTEPGMAMAIFNSLDLLEIALYKSNPNFGGSAAELLGLKVGDSIKITY